MKTKALSKAFSAGALLVLLAVSTFAQTRYYMPSTGAAPVSPAFTGAWNSTVTMVRRKAVTARINSAMADHQITSGATAPEFHGLVQYVSDPIAAQTISGTVKGRIRASESGNSFDGTVAIGIYVYSNDGSTLRGTLFTMQAANSLVAGIEFAATTLTNRALMDVSENATLTLSSVAASDGDRIVFEIGIRDEDAGTTRTARLNFGDDSGTDLPEDNTTTAANNAWLEFSQTITPQGGAPAVRPRPRIIRTELLLLVIVFPLIARRMRKRSYGGLRDA
jgi:hypothetical protein